MYNEDDFIYSSFINNFVNKKIEPIVIYGTGMHTEKLIKKLGADKIAGLMDAQKTGEVLWGLKVLSYEEVSRFPGVCIVIVARNAVINIIYRRIQSFCESNQIDVYDITGKKLGNEFLVSQKHECFLLNEKRLIEKINQCEAVTFDIFDTLIMRKMIAPHDIFSIMNQKLSKRYSFINERNKAERDCGEGKNPTIYEIYNQFQKNVGISNDEKNRLIHLEIETEKKYLCRRDRMCEILDYAVGHGKKVYLVSDMYFTKDILIEILRMLHIEGYLDIFVSCEYRQAKQEGLFGTVQKALDIEANKILHIGDHLYADIKASEDAGFNSYHVYSAGEMFERSIYAHLLPEPITLEEKVILAYFISIAYNNPFSAYKGDGKLVLIEEEKIIKLFIAPVILKFLLFLCQQISRENFELIIFPSRDGFVLQKIYHMIKDICPKVEWAKDIYLYTSRRAALIAAVQNAEDVLDIIQINDSRDRKETIKERFGVEVGDNLIEEGTVTEKLLQKILDKCSEERISYMKYINQLKIACKGKIALVDFMAVGTIQEALQRLMNKEIHGFYFLKRVSSIDKFNNLVCDTMYQKTGDFQMEANIYKYYYFLETILSSYDPTFKSVSKDGKFQFYEECREESVLNLLKSIHTFIMNYAEEILNLLPDIMQCVSSIDLYDKLLGLISEDYSEFNAEELFPMKNIDEFMGQIFVGMNR